MQQAFELDTQSLDIESAAGVELAAESNVETGALDARRLANYLKLQDEIHALDARKNVRAQIDEKRKTKSVSQSLKKLYKSRDR